MRERQLSSTNHPIPFLMTSSGDHILGVYGLTPTVAISKDGRNSWAAPVGAVTELTTITTPVGLAISNQGTPGSTTYGYRISALNLLGESLAGTEVTTTTGAATLNGTNFNRLTWTAVADAASYNVYGRTAGGELKMTNVLTNTYDDTGAVVTPTGSLPTVNSTSGGWYALAGNATDRNTLGALIIHASAAGADPMDVNYVITGYDPFNGSTLGLTSFPVKLTKNVAVPVFPFLMTDSTTHAPKTGLTVTSQRSIDGAAFAPCANSATELGNGMYLIALAASDTNGDAIIYRFTASGADDRLITNFPQPK